MDCTRHLLHDLCDDRVGDGNETGDEVRGGKGENEEGGGGLVPLLVVDVEGQGVAHHAQHQEQPQHDVQDDQFQRGQRSILFFF